MYGNTVDQLWKKFKVAVVIAVICTIIMVVANITSGGFAVRNIGEFLEQILLLILSPLIMTIAIFGWILNWRKVFKGIIAPIPIISMIKEYLVGCFMAIKAFIFMVKNNNANE